MTGPVIVPVNDLLSRPPQGLALMGFSFYFAGMWLMGRSAGRVLRRGGGFGFSRSPARKCGMVNGNERISLAYSMRFVSATKQAQGRRHFILGGQGTNAPQFFPWPSYTAGSGVKKKITDLSVTGLPVSDTVTDDSNSEFVEKDAVTGAGNEHLQLSLEFYSMGTSLTAGGSTIKKWIIGESLWIVSYVDSY
eukprot:g55375.t1